MGSISERMAIRVDLCSLTRDPISVNWDRSRSNFHCCPRDLSTIHQHVFLSDKNGYYGCSTPAFPHHWHNTTHSAFSILTPVAETRKGGKRETTMTGTAHPNEATAYPTNHERMALATRCKLSRLSAGLLVLTLGLWHAPAFDGFYGSSSTMHEGNLHFSSSAKIIQKPKQTPLRPMTVMDLQDVSDSDHGGVRSASRHSAERDPIISLLQQAGIAVDDDVISMLPEWSDVKALYGEEPVVLGMESCDRFRKLNPPERRFVGVAGQMNSGTNALGKYLYDNLRIRSNPFNGGMLAGVPWNKHGWTSLRNRYKFSLPEDVDSVLPVILIRDPYFWMKSK